MTDKVTGSDLEEEQRYLKSLFESVVRMMASDHRSDPHFLKVLDQMEKNEPFIPQLGKAQEELLFKYRLPAWRCILEAVNSSQGFQALDRVVAARWIKGRMKSALVERTIKDVVELTKNEAESLGLRFSTNRLAEETDVFLWWDDDKINGRARDDLSRLLSSLEKEISAQLSPKIIHPGTLTLH